MDHLIVVILKPDAKKPNFDSDHDRVLYLESSSCCIGSLDAVDFVRFVEERYNEKRRWVLNVFMDVDIGSTIGWYLRECVGMKRDKVLVHPSFNLEVHSGLDEDLREWRRKELLSSLV